MTEKQMAFANEYLIDENATRAYRKVYPDCKTDNSAATCGRRLLRNVQIKKYLQKRMKDREKRTEIKQDDVLRELAYIAFSKTSDYVRVIQKPKMKEGQDGDEIPALDENGQQVMFPAVECVPTDQLTEGQKRALAEIRDGRHGIEIKTYDKLKALELLGRHLGMWNDKIDVNVGNREEAIQKLDELFHGVTAEKNNDEEWTQESNGPT